jgi:hypothetical protein
MLIVSGSSAKRTTGKWLSWVLLVLLSGHAGAQIPADQIPDSRSRVVYAERLQGDIVMDGIPNEAAWMVAEPAVTFIQIEPVERELARQDTEVRVLYDDDNIYIAAWLMDQNPAGIGTQLTRRDETPRAVDYFEFSFDSNMDRLTGYSFRVTAAGVQRDMYLFNDTNSDDSWNAIWHSAVNIGEHGWTVEIRMPLSQLRYEAEGAQVWGVNFSRRRLAENERSMWAWTPSVVVGNVSRFGQLHGLNLPQRKRRLEVQPYLMSAMDIAPALPGDPFFNGRETRMQLGVDVRYGLGATFIADIALNPDFGQAEADPQVVNLSAFEIFFPERRSFFTRDDRIFDFDLSGNQNRLFHSRRIGRPPQGRIPVGADFSNVPSTSAIIAAGKVTGRTVGGLSVGVLGAVSDQEIGRAYFADRDESITFIAEPRTNYGIVRVLQDINQGASRFGGMLTVMDRELPADGSLNFLSSQAVTGGVDFEHTWDDRLWALSGFLAGSHVSGNEQAITRIQRSSLHFHQRPDQDYLRFDPNATKLTGAAWEMQLSRRNARFWRGSVTVGQRGPGFEVQDMGFMNINERLFMRGNLQYREPIPGKIFQNYQISLNTEYNWRHSALDNISSLASWNDALKHRHYNFFSGFTFRNWWELNVGSNYRATVLSDTITRGGPLMIDPGFKNMFVNLRGDRRNPYNYGINMNYSDGHLGGRSFSTGLNMEARPSDSLTILASLNYNKNRDIRQYVTAQNDPGFLPTFGGRYWFADLEREEITMNVRANMIFTPNLSLEVFAQPLISAGDYVSYKQLADARTFDFLRFSDGVAVPTSNGVLCMNGNLCRQNGRVFVDLDGNGVVDTNFRDQNFNLRSLRGTAVLRWEYSPGSRLFVVWQQNRESRLNDGFIDVGRDSKAILDAPGEHMFMVKIDRWLDF